ncbi:catalytic protein [Paecilomyces variotii]|uniref:Catalytic protein n=1 Tax=Byssochlamys spectabilis TaxID=264951 RepID=A0A443HMX3_BYSSP|nr:catalytic protein [Paecilomyces variotii]KAJ9363292.1 hypothetical protein DTO280E4_2700 [Paecilomyces variotii]KAJ9387570.1 hypothetical protein DTO063F5_3134 [Paecilomyces variotii]RWQ93176.1 catalytic protein [Paecilomyces variotii]
MATASSSSSVTNKPTLLLVQGSFQLPLVYETLIKGLEAEGYPTVHPQLPSCNPGDADFPTRTLADDSRAVTEALQSLIEKDGKYVVVIMHSYGGLVGSDAVPKELSYESRKQAGAPGGVIHLFYFAAFVLSPGQSVLKAFGESPNNDVRDDGTFTIKNGAEILYNDLPAEEAALWESRLIPQSYKVQETPLSRAAYEYIPSTYLICENDKAAPTNFQEIFARAANAEIDRCNAGHSPMLSQPAMLVKKITVLADKVTPK